MSEACLYCGNPLADHPIIKKAGTLKFRCNGPAAPYHFPDDAWLATMSEEEKGVELRRAVAAGWSEAEAQGTIWPAAPTKIGAES